MLMKEVTLMDPQTRNMVVDAFMDLVAESGWAQATLDRVAERAGTSLGDLRGAYDTRLDILDDFVRKLDETVLAGRDPDMAGEGPRERLFDILFARLEALNPRREAIRSLVRTAIVDPPLAFELNRITTTSMAWMLTAAGIPAAGMGGAFRAQGLALVWAQVLRTWLDDDDPALSRTMAELDRLLRRSERLSERLDRIVRIVRPPRSRPRPSAARPPGGPDVAEGHPS
jgi:AcrR family transcriptional regulator